MSSPTDVVPAKPGADADRSTIPRGGCYSYCCKVCIREFRRSLDEFRESPQSQPQEQRSIGEESPENVTQWMDKCYAAIVDGSPHPPKNTNISFVPFRSVARGTSEE